MTVLLLQSTGAPTLPVTCSPRRRAEQATDWPTMLVSAVVTLALAGFGHVVPSGCARAALEGAG